MKTVEELWPMSDREGLDIAGAILKVIAAKGTDEEVQEASKVVIRLSVDLIDKYFELSRPAPSMDQWKSRSLSRRVSMMDKMIKAVKEKP